MRAMAVRFVLVLLMGFLVVPQLPLPAAHLFDAHASTSGIPADGLPSTTPEESPREYGTCGAPDRRGEANGLLRHRDRHRSTAASTPEALSRSAVASDAVGMLAPSAVAAMGNAHRTSRSSTAHSSPVLQVFRC
ncbi:hypothetical protein [Streptomyces sp. NPDC049970]|uniref:hypothetical protein n=1 Tax=Streptomyces sp. NPDC049970 TaxID=3155033 RepID=UPI0034380296